MKSYHTLGPAATNSTREENLTLLHLVKAPDLRNSGPLWELWLLVSLLKVL